MPPTRRKTIAFQSRFQPKGEPVRKARREPSFDPKHASVSPIIPEDIVDDAENYLFKSPGVPKFIDLNKENQIIWLKDQIVSYNRQNRRQHYETIAQSYAVHAATVNNSTLKEAIAEAGMLQGIKAAPRKSPLRIIVELHISYGDGESKTSIRQAEKNYSRDVNAILNLIKRGIPPSKVLETSEKKGEGLDKWARGQAPDGEVVPAVPRAQMPPMPAHVEPVSNEEPIDRVTDVQREKKKAENIPPKGLMDAFKRLPNQITWSRIRNGDDVAMRTIDLPSSMGDRLNEFLDMMLEEAMNFEQDKKFRQR